MGHLFWSCKLCAAVEQAGLETDMCEEAVGHVLKKIFKESDSTDEPREL